MVHGNIYLTLELNHWNWYICLISLICGFWVIVVHESSPLLPVTVCLQDTTVDLKALIQVSEQFPIHFNNLLYQCIHNHLRMYMESIKISSQFR